MYKYVVNYVDGSHEIVYADSVNDVLNFLCIQFGNNIEYEIVNVKKAVFQNQL